MLSSCSVSCFSARDVAWFDLWGNYIVQMRGFPPLMGVYNYRAYLGRVYAIQFPLNLSGLNSADN